MAVVMRLLTNEDTGEGVTERASGGYQVVADTLNALFPRPDGEIYRQLVYLWWKRRARTHFPEGWERETKNGAVRRFYLDEVVEWYRTHRLDHEGDAA
jgi:hypothetical protein